MLSAYLAAIFPHQCNLSCQADLTSNLSLIHGAYKLAGRMQMSDRQSLMAAGGDTISVTSGVVSRIEVTSYVHGTTELLAIQIDAAINSGNSGKLQLAL